MHPRTYRRNCGTITALGQLKAAKSCLILGESTFSVRLGKKWAQFATAEEVIAFIQGAMALDACGDSEDLPKLLRALKFPENSRRVP